VSFFFFGKREGGVIFFILICFFLFAAVFLSRIFNSEFLLFLKYGLELCKMKFVPRSSLFLGVLLFFRAMVAALSGEEKRQSSTAELIPSPTLPFTVAAFQSPFPPGMYLSLAIQNPPTNSCSYFSVLRTFLP